MTGTSAVRGAERQSAIDVLKAVAIVTVVWIHAFEHWPLPKVQLHWHLMFLTRFAVPTFFFTSGFLYFAATPISANVIWRRLRRLAVPYLVASAVALAGRWLLVGWFPLSQTLYELLTGSAVSVYYFVPVLAGAILLLPLLSRFPAVVAPGLAVLFVGGLVSEVELPGVYVSPANDPFFWELRSPLRWWGYFLAGWVTARHLPRIGALSHRAVHAYGRGALLILAGLFACYAVTQPLHFTRLGGAMQYAAIYATIGGIFFSALGRAQHPLVRWLSQASYPTYLYHPFFISGWQTALGNRFSEAWPITDTAGFIAGMVGSVAVIVASRRLLRERRARLLIG